MESIDQSHIIFT